MLRNAREHEASRQQLIGLAALKRGVVRMAQNFSVDVTDLESLLNDRMQQLSSEIEQYQSLKYQMKPHSPSLELISQIARLPGAPIEARIEIGWSQSDLARYAQMKPQQISKYEKSMYSKISLAKALVIARLLSTKQRKSYENGTTAGSGS